MRLKNKTQYSSIARAGPDHRMHDFLLIILFVILLKSNETKARKETKACHLLQIPWMWCSGVCQHWLLLALRSGCFWKVNTIIVSLSGSHLLFCVFICIAPLFPNAGVSRKRLSNPAHLIPAYVQILFCQFTAHKMFSSGTNVAIYIVLDILCFKKIKIR